MNTSTTSTIDGLDAPTFPNTREAPPAAEPVGKAQVVHESEAQRQFPRVRVPATIWFAAGAERRHHELLDLSAGGFSFERGAYRYRNGEHHHGDLQLRIDGVGFSLPLDFEVIDSDARNPRVGCRFQNLDSAQVAALRHVITAHLGGELVTVGDMLNTLARNNTTAARKKPSLNEGLGPLARARAIAVSTGIFAVGLIAFAYTASKLYDVLFIDYSAAAKVAAPSVTVTMPRDGTFFDLVPDDGVIRKGAPLASYQTALLDAVQGSGQLHLNAELLSQLVGQQLKGSVTSPCDCRILKRFAIDAQYVDRNQPLFELIPQQAKPYVLGRFHYDQIDKLNPGRPVQFRIAGETGSRAGHVRELRNLATETIDLGGFNDLRGINNSSTSTDVIAVIEPEVPLDTALIDRPVEVAVHVLSGSAPWMP